MVHASPQTPVTRHKPSGRFKHAAVSLDDRLVVFGGRGLRGYSEGVHVLDAMSGAWTTLQPYDSVCPCGREGHSASSVAGKVYVFGGWRGGQFFNDGAYRVGTMHSLLHLALLALEHAVSRGCCHLSSLPCPAFLPPAI